MSKIADKISKLIAKAESTTHPEEADSFMLMVHKLLEQHGMSLLDVGKLNSEDPVGQTSDAGKFYASESAFRDVAFYLAEYYGCKAVVHVHGNHRNLSVFGRDSARITFELMWPYVKKCIRSEARRLHNVVKAEFAPIPVPSKLSTVARQQRWVADALSSRLLRAIHDRRRETPEQTGVNALVPVDLIQQLMDDLYDDIKTAKDRQLKTTAEAREAAGNINLNEQVDSAERKKRKLIV